MALPIIFFHYGNPDYLKYTLKQARFYNPASPMYLIGDKINGRYPFLTHVNAADYDAETETFAKIYKHLSPNDRQYELNCFLRWFYIRAFCKDKGIEAFVYLDSDVLAFQNLSDLVPMFKHCKLANNCYDTGSPAFTYFNDYNTIADFCDYLIWSYTDKGALVRIEDLYKSPGNISRFGGISDMSLFHLYDLDHPGDTLKVDLVTDELAVDVSINRADGYETRNGMKVVYWKSNQPYCKNVSTGKLVRFATLHYQGDSKRLIIKHYKGGGYLVDRWRDPLKAGIKKFKKSLRKR